MRQPPEPRRRQERGVRRIAGLIDAAEQVFGKIGYNAATTNAIAAQAKVSPGTLYQFFPNKESLAEALAARYVDGLAGVHESLEPSKLAEVPLEMLAESIVDPFLRFHRKHPAFDALFVEAGASTGGMTRLRALDEALIHRLAGLFTARSAHLAPGEARLIAEACCAIFKGFLPLISSKTGATRSRAVRELKAALVRYTAPALDR